MKAVLLTGHGGPEKLVYGDAPDPLAGPGEVVVDVHAASVNAADYKVRLGSYDSKLKFPYILGRDFSGVVSALGSGVTDFKIGDPVFGVMDAGIEGCYAEKIIIAAAIIAKKPDTLGHAEAAAQIVGGSQYIGVFRRRVHQLNRRPVPGRIAAERIQRRGIQKCQRLFRSRAYASRGSRQHTHHASRAIRSAQVQKNPHRPARH